MLVNVSKPSTIYVSFPSPPRTFEVDSVSDSGQDRYYWRFLDGKTPRIKFNIPDSGNYVFNVPVDIVKIVPIEIPSNFPTLPPANRDRWQSTTKVYNPSMDDHTTTPIRIYSKSGIIEYGNRFLSYAKPVQIFLEQHEKGHMFYIEEENCDMYALINFLRMGYNQSTAYAALLYILKRSPQKTERLRALFNNIQKVRKK